MLIAIFIVEFIIVGLLAYLIYLSHQEKPQIKTQSDLKGLTPRSTLLESSRKNRVIKRDENDQIIPKS